MSMLVHRSIPTTNRPDVEHAGPELPGRLPLAIGLLGLLLLAALLTGCSPLPSPEHLGLWLADAAMGPPSAPEELPPVEVRILYTGDVAGWIDKCG